MDTDSEQLRLLSIFHYVVGALAALASLLPLMHLFMGLAMLTGRFDEASPAESRLFGWFFIVMASVMIAIGAACTAAILLTGHFLSRRRHYMFCLVVAAIECLFVPVGTILGVFTIVVLQRPSVKALFAQSA